MRLDAIPLELIPSPPSSFAVLVDSQIVDTRLANFNVADPGLNGPSWLVAVPDDEASIVLVDLVPEHGDVVGHLLLQGDLEQLSSSSLEDLGEHVVGLGGWFGLGEERRLLHVAYPSPLLGTWVSV